MSKPISELIIASHNQGKVREISELVAPLAIRVLSASELGLPEPEETGETFEANAALKAESAALRAGKPALADDSGLCVKALDDAPGIYSARWGGPKKDFAMAMETVRSALETAGVAAEGADAYFVCVLALAIPGQPTRYFRGEVHGTLTFPPRGEHGFGYDPIFVPTHPDFTEGLTFAQIAPETKHRISHRAAAFRLFMEHLNGH